MFEHKPTYVIQEGRGPSHMSSYCPVFGVFIGQQVVAFLPPDEDIGTHAHGTQGEAAEGGPRGSAASQHWLLFDSHPRPQLGLTGASVQRFGEESALLAALVQIFPAVEVEAGNVLASMYNMVDCTPLVLRGAES